MITKPVELKVPLDEEIFAYLLIDHAETALFNAQKDMWTVCYISAQIVGSYSDKTQELADRLGKSRATIEFYAKAWRVRQYVKDETVPCSLDITGLASAELICNNLTFTHYGVIHRKIFKSIREENQMKYIPVISPRDTLAWLAECVEPLMQDQKRLSPEALITLMQTTPDQSQWFDSWPTLKSKLLNFILQFGERMPEHLRDLIAELIQQDWE